MIRRLQRLSKEINKLGFGGGIKWLFIIGRRIVPRRQVIWCIDLLGIDSESFSLPDNIEIKRYYKEDEIEHDDYVRLVETGTELMGSNARQLVKKRFSNGAQLWLIKENGQTAGYRWTIVKDPLTPTYIPHTETDVHGIGGELFEEFRGRGLFEILTKFHFITLKNEGFLRFYGETYEWNKSAVHSLAKTNRKVGVAKRFSIFGRNVVIWYEMSNNSKFRNL
jgi:hypothetical protein